MTETVKADDILKRASAVAKQIQIDSIWLVHSNFQRFQVGDAVGDVVVDFAFKPPKYEFDLETKTLLVMIGLMTSGKDDENDTFKIEAYYALQYILEGDAPEPDDLEAFASANGIYNVWPYWREYAQSASGRMGIGQVMMPVLTSGMIGRMLQDMKGEMEVAHKLAPERHSSPAVPSEKKPKKSPKSH